MYNIIASKFMGELVFVLSDLYFFFSTLVLVSLGMLLNHYILSLNLNKLIIDLSLLPIFFTIFFALNNYNINADLSIGVTIDDFFISFKVIFLCFFFLFVVISRNVFLLDKVYNYEFILLVLLSMQGSILMVCASNLFVFFLAIEIQTLCFYILASLKRYSNFSAEAGIKYFLFGAFSSSLLLFGVSILYGIFGTLDISNMFFIMNNYNFAHSILLYLSFFFLFSGMMFKLGAAPFHW